MRLDWKKDVDRIISLNKEEIIILGVEHSELKCIIGKRAKILARCKAGHFRIELLEDNKESYYHTGSHICNHWLEFKLVNDPDNNY